MVALCACATHASKSEVTLTLPTVASASATPLISTNAHGPFDLTFANDTHDARWQGAHANVSSPIFGFWGERRDVFAIGSHDLYRSSDRGVHWTRSTAARGSAISGASIADLWVVGTDVARSTDDGVTWQLVGNLSHALGVGGRDGSDVFVVGVGFISHTTDHGRTFTPIVHGSKDDIFFDVASAPPDLYVVGSRHVAAPSSPLGYHTVPVILRFDGANAISTLTAPVPNMTDNEETRHMCFTSSGTMFVSMAYTVHASSDRGTTWRLAATVGTEVLGLACEGREVIATGRNKRFLDSTDDGVTWREHDLDGVLPGRELIALQAAYLSLGAAFVGGEAYVDHDAGTLLRRGTIAP